MFVAEQNFSRHYSISRWAMSLLTDTIQSFRKNFKNKRNRALVRGLVDYDDHLLRDIGLERHDIVDVLINQSGRGHFQDATHMLRHIARDRVLAERSFNNSRIYKKDLVK